MQRLCALMRAEARGESGTLMAWTPNCARMRAPSISFVQEMPEGHDFDQGDEAALLDE